MLSSHDRELFHNVVAKGIFVSSRSRPDITPTISILSGRVRSPNRSDWEKCRRLVRYLRCTQNLHVVLRYDDLGICKWHVDASFRVHSNFKIYSGGVMLCHPGGGGIASGSNKQKLNSRSSTEAELVELDNFLTKI